MKKLTITWGTILAVLVFGMAWAEKPKEVTVVNDPSNPVPVTGETTVTGNVTLEGTSEVNVANTPLDVNIINTPADPALVRDVDNNLRTPFAWDGEGTYTVPLNRRLVIELFTMRAFSVDTPSHIAPYIKATTNGTTVDHYLQVTVQDYTITPGYIQRDYTGSQAVRIYADPGSEVTTGRWFSGNFTTYRLSISGYLEDIPLGYVP